MPWPEHYRVITEVRALGYEIEQLERAGNARALGMRAVRLTMQEWCGPDAEPAELLSEETSEIVRQLRDVVEDTWEERERLAIVHGEQTRPYSLGEHEDFAHVVDAAAARAYFVLARESGVRQENLRQYPGSCSPMFYILQRNLRKQGIETQHMWWFEAGNNHHFLRTVNVPNATFDIDPTWQQALPKGSDYAAKPHVLIAPSSQLETALVLHDVPESLRRMWLDAKVDRRPEDDPSSWNRELAAIFEDDPWLPAAVTQEN
jgi:hypothetical protein